MTFANPFFDVVRQPMFAELDGKRIETSREALINPEMGIVVGEVSKNYKVVTNSEVAKVFDDAFSHLSNYEVYDHLNGTTGRWCRDIILQDTDYTFNIGHGDTCKTKISVFNGYTGKQSAGFSVSAYRLVCSNGLMGWKNELSVSISHIRNGIVDEIRNKFFQKVEVFQKKTEIWEAWADDKFTQKDFNLFINTREHLSDKMKEKFKGLYVPIMQQYGESQTRWGAYNVLTAIATHYTQARKGSNVFSNAYKRVEKLVDEFELFDPSDHSTKDITVST
jgi:hypothetical protein